MRAPEKGGLLHPGGGTRTNLDESRVGSAPKTARSRRTVASDAGTVNVLRAHRASQAVERLQMGTGWRDHDLILPRVDGEPLAPERASREFDRRVERWESPKLTLHGLRQTWATLALRTGVHPMVVQERLGHSPIGDHPRHLLPRERRDAGRHRGAGAPGLRWHRGAAGGSGRPRCGPARSRWISGLLRRGRRTRPRRRPPARPDASSGCGTGSPRAGRRGWARRPRG